MRIFLDTANIDEIKKAVKLGVICGVTTNPSLVSKESATDYEAVTREICAIVPGPVSVEVLVEEAQDMIEQARKIAAWAPNVVIKIPATTAGLEATSALSRDKIKVNFTLCFSLNQAILGARAGATYVSPFVGRLDDIGHDGMETVRDIVDAFSYYELPTQVIASSIRHTQHCLTAIKVGAHIATIPYKVLVQMMQHPLTDIGVARFLADGRSIPNK